MSSPPPGGIAQVLCFTSEAYHGPLKDTLGTVGTLFLLADFEDSPEKQMVFAPEFHPHGPGGKLGIWRPYSCVFSFTHIYFHSTSANIAQSQIPPSQGLLGNGRYLCRAVPSFVFSEQLPQGNSPLGTPLSPGVAAGCVQGRLNKCRERLHVEELRIKMADSIWGL